MPGILSYQPFATLYVVYALITTLIVLPFWILRALPRSWRPVPSWDLKRVIFVRLFQRGAAVVGKTGLLQGPTHRALGPSGDDFGGVWVPGVPELVTAQLKTWAQTASVSCVRIPGYWLREKGSRISLTSPPRPGEKVLYAMHGGAYTRMTAHPANPMAEAARGILKTCDTIHRVFFIEYRLSIGPPDKPANPFPAALLDALAGYNYLVNNVGFSPSDIVMEGDSSGGNLALALTRYLVEHQNVPGVEIPAPPGSLLLLSPWADIGKSHDRVCTTDYVEGSHDLEYSTAAFLAPHGSDEGDRNPYISPGSVHPSMQVSFKGFPRTFIVAGGVEYLYPQIMVMVERMVKDLGEGNGVKDGEGKVILYVAKDGVHDYLLLTWHEPERRETLQAIREWVAAAT